MIASNCPPIIRFVSFLFFTFFTCTVFAAAGSPDTSFGGGKGWTSTGFQRVLVYANVQSAIRQADGKLVVAGTSNRPNTSYYAFSVSRYNSDGTLDTTFNGSGTVETTIGSGRSDYASDVIQQADGKLVVAGYSITSNYDFALVRYNSNGTLDTTFNGGGIVTTDIGGNNDYAHSVIQLANGKLLVAGNTDYVFALTRYNTDGTLDTTFKSTGKVTTDISAYTEYAYSVIEQTDGKLVVAGSSGQSADFTLVRYYAGGSLDTTFNGNGKVITPIGSAGDFAYSVIQQADGKLVAAGNSNNGANFDFALVRYNSNGALDTSFNGTGKLTTAINTSHTAFSVIQQADGKLVAAGGEALVRYNSNGTLDTAFNGTGKVVTTGLYHGHSVVQHPDGKLVVAGGSGSFYSNFSLARYNSNGELDNSFNGTGLVNTERYMSEDNATSVIQQADGKLVAAGHSIGTDNQISLARFNADGTLDTTFNGTGKTTAANFPNGSSAAVVIQQMDGKLVTGGSDLLRYNSNGSLDTIFDNTMDYIESVIQQSDGKLVAAGTSHEIWADEQLELMRYNADGSLDTTFNGTGKVVNGALEKATSVIQQADGKLVAAGIHRGSRMQSSLARYNSNGTLDTTFNSTGIVINDFAELYDHVSVLQQLDGKLVVASTTTGINRNFSLVRYNLNGSLDTTFNGTGKTTAGVGTCNDSARSIIQQTDGKLVVTGTSCTGTGALMRFNLNGILDATFNGTGIVIISMNAITSGVSAVIQQADGKLAVAGYAANKPTGTEFVVMRFESGQLIDSDGDGVLDAADAFPLDALEWLDTDSDGTGNNADRDDDGDGTPDVIDIDPLNPIVNENDFPFDGSYKGSTIQESALFQ